MNHPSLQPPFEKCFSIKWLTFIGFGDMALSSYLVEQAHFGGCCIGGILCTLDIFVMDQFNMTWFVAMGIWFGAIT
jgi:hypothetical protein